MKIERLVAVLLAFILIWDLPGTAYAAKSSGYWQAFKIIDVSKEGAKSGTLNHEPAGQRIEWMIRSKWMQSNYYDPESDSEYATIVFFFTKGEENRIPMS